MTTTVRCSPPGPLHNHVLGSMEVSSFAVLMPHLEAVSVKCGAVLSTAGVPPQYAYFPTTAILSLQQGIDGGPGPEVALVGCEGMTGVSIVVGDGSSSRNAVVYCAGLAFRLPAQVLRDEFAASPDLRSTLLRCFQFQIAQVAQNVACYRLHSVDQQVCRRLLMLLDMLPTAEVSVTHELLASALGVRREAITISCSRLLAEGIIQPGRGRILVLERTRLEACACECRSSLSRAAARFLPAAENVSKPDRKVSFR